MELSGVVECAADVGFIQVANLFWVGKLEVLRHLEITILGFGLNSGGYSACEACGLPRLATGGWPPHPGCSGRACSCRSLVLLGVPLPSAAAVQHELALPTAMCSRFAISAR